MIDGKVYIILSDLREVYTEDGEPCDYEQKNLSVIGMVSGQGATLETAKKIAEEYVKNHGCQVFLDDEDFFPCWCGWLPWEANLSDWDDPCSLIYEYEFGWSEKPTEGSVATYQVKNFKQIMRDEQEDCDMWQWLKVEILELKGRKVRLGKRKKREKIKNKRKAH